MSTHCGICFGEGHTEQNCNGPKPKHQYHPKPVQHLLAGTLMKVDTHVYRYDEKGVAVLKAFCISEEAAVAAFKLLSS